jgi:regulatory protein
VKITSIKQQVKRADRYSLYVEGKYAFSLSESVLLDSKLAGGQEIDEAQLADYKKLSQDDKAYGNALRYSAMRPHSTWEMQQYFRRKAIEEPVAERIIERLTRIGLVDDLAFARSWVASRHLLKDVSNRRLLMELRQKQVPSTIIEQVLSEDEVDERQSLRELIIKKRSQLKYRDDPTKLMQYLARQGFGYDDIKAMLLAIDEEEE